MIYIMIWLPIIAFVIGVQLGKKTYHIELKNKLKNRFKISEEALLDYTINYFEL